jgi:uncharacterized protein (DUF2164 family)
LESGENMNKTKLFLNIDDYLKSEINISARDLSTHLIESFGFSDKLFSTGRPKIYSGC